MLLEGYTRRCSKAPKNTDLMEKMWPLAWKMLDCHLGDFAPFAELCRRERLDQLRRGGLLRRGQLLLSPRRSVPLRLSRRLSLRLGLDRRPSLSREGGEEEAAEEAEEGRTLFRGLESGE